MKKLIATFAAAALTTLLAATTLLLGVAATPASATTPGPDNQHVASRAPLPGCAMVLAPKASSDQGRVCLQKSVTLAAGSSAAASPGVCIYQNGPVFSPAWANGWELCAYGSGDLWVPPAYNDQASSWISGCTSGVFYAYQPGTAPWGFFPANSAGNFPWGGVPNDALSSLSLDWPC
ncbi:hypothetical protein ACQP1V_43465 (plasmid) [Microtetraspora malaysiensis]|uniref:hypothetical protein n=1 Tax=Microtetraspora malaysiensis TaxID=161358 RepID=UPI003D8AB321